MVDRTRERSPAVSSYANVQLFARGRNAEEIRAMLDRGGLGLGHGKALLANFLSLSA